MKLGLFWPMWGTLTHWEEVIPAVARQGYAGIELGVLCVEPDRLRGMLRDHGLRMINVVQTSGDSIQQHLDELRAAVDRWAALGAVRITAHTAADRWPIAQSVEFYGRCVELERSLPIAVAHETHRSRAFFNPWSTRDILRQVPAVRLCCDFSHWVCVAERLLADSADEITLAASHCIHVHTRVGHAQGPQVPDPSAPECAAELAAHEAWWRQIWQAHASRGESEMTATPEFGPPPYMQTLPHTNVPVADRAAVIEWTSARLRTLFPSA